MSCYYCCAANWVNDKTVNNIHGYWSATQSKNALCEHFALFRSLIYGANTHTAIILICQK